MTPPVNLCPVRSADDVPNHLTVQSKQMLQRYGTLKLTLYGIMIGVLTFMAFGYSGHTVVTLPGVVLTAFSFAISIAMCGASYRYFESPILNLRLPFQSSPASAKASVH